MKQALSVILALFLSLAVMAGCSSSTDSSGEASEPDEQAGTVEAAPVLEDWEGLWNDLSAYSNSEQPVVACEILTEHGEEALQSDISALSISGDTILAWLPWPDGGGSDSTQASFTRQGEVVDGSGRTWNCFTTDEDVPYTVFLMLKTEDDGGSARHFHYRYGTNVDELLIRYDWFPTVILYDGTYDQENSEIAFHGDSAA